MAATATPRYECGVRVPDSCRFCGSENMTASADWATVTPHSHDGVYVTIIACEDCGGELVTRERGNKRVTTLDERTVVAQHWDVPEGYCLTYCTDCGELAGAHDLCADKPLLEAIERGDITTDCCGAVGGFEGDRFEVER